MDRGATRELVVSGMSTTSLVAILEGAAVMKGFRIVKKEYFHNSTIISAKKGDLVEAMAVDILTDGISKYTQSGNIYGMDADISERGGRLRLYIGIYPLSGVLEQGSLIGMMDRPMLNLILDPSSNRLLEDVLDKMKSRGVVLEPLQAYQDTIGLKAGEKTIDDTGWTVQRSHEMQLGVSSSYDYRFWGLITSIMGFIGFIMLGSMLLIGIIDQENSMIAISCIGFFLSLFGFPGMILSIMAIVKSGKGKRILGIVALVFSIPPVLTIIILVVVVIASFLAVLESL